MPKIILADKAGFCYGVKRAIDLASQVKGKGFSLGEIIHNPQMMAKLEAKGITVVQSLSQVPDGSTVIIRAHGVSDKVLFEAKHKNLKIINTTCPFVNKVHILAKQMAQEGRQVIVLGEKEHPEVKGIVENLDQPVVVSSLAEAKLVKNYEQIGFVSQTTQQHQTFNDIKRELANHTGDLKAIDTICDATSERQQAATELAKQVDLMIVIGGRASGNTKRLYEICKSITEAIKIETVAELYLDKINKYKTIGITAGASTPDWLIQEVIDKIEKMD